VSALPASLDFHPCQQARVEAELETMQDFLFQ